MADFDGRKVNEVLRLVASLTDDGDTQLTILMFAFVTACRSINVDQDAAIAAVQDAFDDKKPLVPLFQS